MIVIKFLRFWHLVFSWVWNNSGDIRLELYLSPKYHCVILGSTWYFSTIILEEMTENNILLSFFQTTVARLQGLDGSNNARSIEIASIRRENFPVFLPKSIWEDWNADLKFESSKFCILLLLALFLWLSH